MSTVLAMRFGTRLLLGLFLLTHATKEETPQSDKYADVFDFHLFWFWCDIDRSRCCRCHCRHQRSGGFGFFVTITDVINRNSGLRGN
jgi:hypothetical protein